MLLLGRWNPLGGPLMPCPKSISTPGYTYNIGAEKGWQRPFPQGSVGGYGMGKRDRGGRIRECPGLGPGAFTKDGLWFVHVIGRYEGSSSVS